MKVEDIHSSSCFGIHAVVKARMALWRQFKKDIEDLSNFEPMQILSDDEVIHSVDPLKFHMFLHSIPKPKLTVLFFVALVLRRLIVCISLDLSRSSVQLIWSIDTIPSLPSGICLQIQLLNRRKIYVHHVTL